MWATWLNRILQSHHTSRCICTHTYTHIFYQAYEVSPQPQCHHWFRISAVGQYLTLGFETSLWKDSWPPLPHWISGGCGSTAAPKIWMNITKPATRWNGWSQNLICYWIVWWRFPKSREYHQIIQSLDHDLVLKQPCWLGDPPFSETTILNPHWTVLFNGSSPPRQMIPFSPTSEPLVTQYSNRSRSSNTTKSCGWRSVGSHGMSSWRSSKGTNLAMGRISTKHLQ